MKVLLAQNLYEEAMAALKPIATIKPNKYDRLFSREEFLSELKDVDAVLIHWHTDIMDKEAIDQTPNLKVIGRIGLGIDNIDVEYATEKGIYVTYTPVNAPTVADTTFALMMAVARRIAESDKYIKDKKWTEAGMAVLDEFRGHNIHNRKLGIIGFGRVGTTLAKRAKGFDMEVCYSDPLRNEDVEKELGVRYAELDELLKTSDFIAVTCSLTDSSKNIIGEREIGLMKKDAIFVNSSRGPTFDQKALCRALANGDILGAGLDVFEKEPIDFDDPILKLDNVVLIPHVGSNTYETIFNMQKVACDEVANVLQGKTPQYIVNPDVKAINPLK